MANMGGMGGMMGGGGGGGMGWLGAIGGGIIAGKQAYSANKITQEEYERWQDAMQRAMAQLSVKKIMALQQKLIPLFRANLGASGFGGNFGEAMNAALMKAGIGVDSPIGAALSGAASAAPALKAFEASLGKAFELSMARAQMKMGMMPPYPSSRKMDVRTEAGAAMGRGFGMMGLQQGQPTMQMPTQQQPSMSMPRSSYSGSMTDFTNWINSNPTAAASLGF